jgi:hypothetical protein
MSAEMGYHWGKVDAEEVLEKNKIDRVVASRPHW